ncbi:MAG: (2Fe-2S) ferredoxin domain-containing protein [Pseudomonadales bacterium]|jgi:NADH:ubiquinone oxidoreductase subunit E|nr:(2Fe-2S) ferredoxin domain-containing protein [Pseudomonadales bacterium]MDG1442673.1 (2Fe-2S) ferredoxin domain-containing protein [Pseudomonadales bacterium]
MKKVFVCTNHRKFSDQPSCAARGSESLLDFLKSEVSLRDLDVEVESSVCMGHCAKGPNIKISDGDFIHGANQDLVDELLLKIDAYGNRPTLT